MELLRLVIVDDEEILLRGLVDTYDWESMGFYVVGSAQSGQEAIHVIRETLPHVVLTDIRMKQITGLMVMEEIQKSNLDCLFIILSAYRDFNYAKRACELGAFDYLVKPIEEDELRKTMTRAREKCLQQLSREQKLESWEHLLVSDSSSFVRLSLQQYIDGQISADKLREIFLTLRDVVDEEKARRGKTADGGLEIQTAVRKNDAALMKEAFIQFIYDLPSDEEEQCRHIHYMLLKMEFMIEESYGMSEELKKQFLDYYSEMKKLSSLEAVHVAYQILQTAVHNRQENTVSTMVGEGKDYMYAALVYIDKHLDEEELSIVAVATHVYLNPVYFGRVFKNTFHMTFKQYLLQRRMEKAKLLLSEKKHSISSICEQVGIGNPSYFSHLFKQYTGKLPSEYKKLGD